MGRDYGITEWRVMFVLGMPSLFIYGQVYGHTIEDAAVGLRAGRGGQVERSIV